MSVFRPASLQNRTEQSTCSLSPASGYTYTSNLGHLYLCSKWSSLSLTCSNIKTATSPLMSVFLARRVFKKCGGKARSASLQKCSCQIGCSPSSAPKLIYQLIKGSLPAQISRLEFMPSKYPKTFWRTLCLSVCEDSKS